MALANPVRWGLVATIKATAPDILNFAAYHLEAGAHRLYLYLDAPCPEAMPFLKAHPKIRVIQCDQAYWQKQRKSRPDKHQVRQTINATRAYRRQAGDLDWLIHMDVDEFLWSDLSFDQLLGALTADQLCARLRPAESLSRSQASSQAQAQGGDGQAFKKHIANGPGRDALIQSIYPTYGKHVKGGFLSHVQGKLFVRTGMEDIEFRIHNVFQNGQANPGQVQMTQASLCHLHGKDWDSWNAQFRYRLTKGSYRADLQPNVPRHKGGVSMHELLKQIESTEGPSGLRAFYDELCADTPNLRARLQANGLLLLCDLQMTRKRHKHFPEFSQNPS